MKHPHQINIRLSEEQNAGVKKIKEKVNLPDIIRATIDRTIKKHAPQKKV